MQINTQTPIFHELYFGTPEFIRRSIGILPGKFEVVPEDEDDEQK